MNYTSIEQSKKLLELGLSPKSADMNWHELPNIGKFVRAFPYVHDNGATEGILPCWSVGALLEVMPKQIFSEDCIKYYVPTLYIVERASIGYQAMNEFLCIKDGKTLIEAIYEMVVWLLENNYIKKGE